MLGKYFTNRQVKEETTTSRPLGGKKPEMVCRGFTRTLMICTWRTTLFRKCLAYKPYESAPTTTPRPFKANFVTPSPKTKVFDDITFLQGFLKSYCQRLNPFQQNKTASNPDTSNNNKNNNNGRNSSTWTRSNIHSGNWF